MNRTEFVDQAAAQIAVHAGGYLFNTILEPGVTCVHCRVPVVSPFEVCHACNVLNGTGLQRADRLAFLVYAIQHMQSESMMYGYKGAQGFERHRSIMRMLVTVGFFGHSVCALKLGGGTCHRWAVVPSLKGRKGLHPLADIVRSLTVPGFDVELVPAQRISDPRAFDPRHFTVSTQLPDDCHVFLIDDTWVGGGHAESAGLALRESGATQVSILSIARMLNMDRWPPNRPFVKERLSKPFDSEACPWTPDGVCP